MTRAAILLTVAALGLGPGSALASARSHLVVVELFTAQGCVSCDKASAVIDDLTDRDGVVALTLPVDYWDYLGWPDTFAMARFTDRQKAYERHFGLQDVYTPQVVVDGAAQASGDDGPEVDSLVAKARRDRDHGPTILVRHGGARVTVGAGRRPRGGAEVWLVRYDPRTHHVQVKAGDNRGATVVDRNVVRQMVRLGSWKGERAVYRLPPADQPGLASLVLVQGDHGGPILAARALGEPRD
jgi:hypothetical protein